MVEPKQVKVGIQITDDEGGRLPREWLWAEVVRQDAAGGIYCLLNAAFYGPFALGDLLEARRRRNGELIVTGLHRRGGLALDRNLGRGVRRAMSVIPLG